MGHSMFTGTGARRANRSYLAEAAQSLARLCSRFLGCLRFVPAVRRVPGYILAPAYNLFGYY